MFRPLHALLLLPLVAACAGEGKYPSLAMRPAEARGWVEPPAPAPAPVPDDPVLDRRIATASAALKASGAAFATADARAAPLAAAARGAAAGSDRWIAAQSALADLDAARSATGEAAGTLEDLAAARAQALGTDYPPLETARAAAAAQLDAEATRIRTLGAALPAG